MPRRKKKEKKSKLTEGEMEMAKSMLFIMSFAPFFFLIDNEINFLIYGVLWIVFTGVLYSTKKKKKK